MIAIHYIGSNRLSVTEFDEANVIELELFHEGASTFSITLDFCSTINLVNPPEADTVVLTLDGVAVSKKIVEVDGEYSTHDEEEDVLDLVEQAQTIVAEPTLSELECSISFTNLSEYSVEYSGGGRYLMTYEGDIKYQKQCTRIDSKNSPSEMKCFYKVEPASVMKLTNADFKDTDGMLPNTYIIRDEGTQHASKVENIGVFNALDISLLGGDAFEGSVIFSTSDVSASGDLSASAMISGQGKCKVHLISLNSTTELTRYTREYTLTDDYVMCYAYGNCTGDKVRMEVEFGSINRGDRYEVSIVYPQIEQCIRPSSRIKDSRIKDNLVVHYETEDIDEIEFKAIMGYAEAFNNCILANDGFKLYHRGANLVLEYGSKSIQIPTSFSINEEVLFKIGINPVSLECKNNHFANEDVITLGSSFSIGSNFNNEHSLLEPVTLELRRF